MSAPAVRLIEVTKRYAGPPAVNQVSLDVPSGQVTALLGPSGCGKTTILRLIAGLEVPDDGEILIGERSVSGARRLLVPPHERGVGFVFQDLALWPHLSVRQSLEFVLRAAAVPRAGWRQRAQDVLALARIPALADRHPHELSGGEQQRAAVARAIVGRPRLLLLDEPLSSLDPDLRAALREEFASLQRTLGVTLIYVTHDREEAYALAERVVSMRQGRVESIAVARPASG